jgi:hypothetical protein
MIYDVAGQKFRKKLPDQEHECNDYFSKEFLACAFSVKSEKNHLVTLTGEPDWLIILWQWDKTKILASYSVGVQQPSAFMGNYQLSFNPYENCSVVLSGPSIYKYYQVKELSEFVEQHHQLNNKDREVSTNYSCHQWMDQDGSLRLILCTAEGDIMALENSGDFQAYLTDCPANN